MIELFADIPEELQRSVNEWSRVLNGENVNQTIAFGDHGRNPGSIMCFTLLSVMPREKLWVPGKLPMKSPGRCRWKKHYGNKGVS